MELAKLLKIKKTLEAKTTATRKQRILKDRELADIDRLIGRVSKIG